MKKLVITLLCSVAFIQGCSKGAPDAVVDLRTPAMIAAEAKQVELEKRAAAAPKADKSVPLTEYREIDGGKALMFAYLSIDAMPVDYEMIADKVSVDYRRERDEFKRRDMLVALKPGIDREIAKAKESRYFFMVISDKLDKYDFESKSFGNTGFGGLYPTRTFSDGKYSIKFINNTLFNKVVVLDEERARTIEGLRAKHQGLRLTVYFFLSDTELGDTVVNVETTKFRVTDSNGSLLAEI